MQLIRTEGPEIVRCGPITSTIGAVLEVDEATGTALLGKTSVTFNVVGDVSVKPDQSEADQ